MSQLTKRDEITLPESNLPASQQSFVVLRVGHKAIKEMQPNSLKRALTDILTLSSFEAGSPMGDDPVILNAQTLALFGELKGRFLDLTLPEIQEAFNQGVRGQSGPYFGFCSKTYHQFLKWFFELPERQKSWISYLEEQNAKLPRSEKPVWFTKDYFANAAKTAFEDFKTKGTLPMIPFAVYDAIKEVTGAKSLIRQEDWAEVKEEAKKAYKAQITKGRTKDLKNLVLNYSLENRSFEFHVKEIGLRRYFEKLISEGKELEL
jgi:hypothetical protein